MTASPTLIEKMTKAIGNGPDSRDAAEAMVRAGLAYFEANAGPRPTWEWLYRLADEIQDRDNRNRGGVDG